LEKALEGKDVKDLLLNVGSGGGAAAPAAGGAASGAGAGDAAAEAPKEEEKEEGNNAPISADKVGADITFREGGIRRGYGFWSLRLIHCLVHRSWSSQVSDTCMGLRGAERSRLRIVITICAGPTEIDIGRWLQLSGVRARICSRRQYESQ
jgi:60s Acidic ribosomal protein